MQARCVAVRRHSSGTNPLVIAHPRFASSSVIRSIHVAGRQQTGGTHPLPIEYPHLALRCVARAAPYHELENGWTHELVPFGVVAFGGDALRASPLFEWNDRIIVPT